MASFPRCCAVAGPSRWQANVSSHQLRSVASPLPPLRRTSLPSPRSFSCTPPHPSGSNRWSKIRHKKAIQDSARSNVFGRLTRDLVAAIRSGGPLPESNTRLAVALKKAKELNFPKDRLENTFAKADKSGETLTAVTYEALGPPSAQGGAAVALVIECSTDSPGRTHAKVKEIFNKSASSNYRLSSVGHLFQKRGVIRLALASGEAGKFDEVFEVALENGAEEVSEVEAENEAQGKIVQEGGIIVEILCEPSQIDPISSKLTSYNLLEAEQRTLPSGPWLRIRDEEDPEEVQAGEAAQRETDALTEDTAGMGRRGDRGQAGSAGLGAGGGGGLYTDMEQSVRLAVVRGINGTLPTYSSLATVRGLNAV